MVPSDSKLRPVGCFTIPATFLALFLVASPLTAFDLVPMPGAPDVRPAEGAASELMEPASSTIEPEAAPRDLLDDVMATMVEEIEADIETLESNEGPADLLSVQEATTLGDLSAIRQDIYRMERLVELYERRQELRALMRSGGDDDRTVYGQELQGGFNLPSDISRSLLPDEPAVVYSVPDRSPLVTRVYTDARGRIAADLIYRNGEAVHGAIEGMQLPGGRTCG